MSKTQRDYEVETMNNDLKNEVVVNLDFPISGGVMRNMVGFSFPVKGLIFKGIWYDKNTDMYKIQLVSREI